MTLCACWVVTLDCFALIGLLRKKASWHPPSMPLTCFHFARGLLPASGASLCNVTAPSQGVWLPMQKQRIKTNKASAAYEKASISTAFNVAPSARGNLPQPSAALCQSVLQFSIISTGGPRFCHPMEPLRR
ncbi:hypothetical protein QQF64_021428 [Cirrhinus molitorella]|uniref:Secreted protein n=1 Tax=Cirrhinus molitorella TaxID=172907 RepID=A0ABR3LC54_9TELE